MSTLVALVLGAVTTVAVAWYFALPASGHYMYAPWSGDEGADLVPNTDPTDAVTFIELRRSWYIGSAQVSVTYWPSAVRPRNAPNDEDRGKVTFNEWHLPQPIEDLVSPFSIEDAAPEFITLKPIAGVLPTGAAGIGPREYLVAGWPMYALQHRIFCVSSPPPVWRFEGCLVYRRSGSWRTVFLPYHPLPIGFGVNTALYASLWTAFFFAVASMRRRLRTRRNLCPHCAYDLSATPAERPCPECGAIGRRPKGPKSKEPPTHN